MVILFLFNLFFIFKLFKNSPPEKTFSAGSIARVIAHPHHPMKIQYDNKRKATKIQFVYIIINP